MEMFITIIILATIITIFISIAMATHNQIISSLSATMCFIFFALAVMLFHANMIISQTNYTTKINSEEQTERVLIKKQHKDNEQLKSKKINYSLRNKVNKLNNQEIHKVRTKTKSYKFLNKYRKNPVRNMWEMMNQLAKSQFN